MAHVKALSVDIGIRAAGTDGEQQAADYIETQLESFGYTASQQPFAIDVFQGISTALEVVNPQRSIDVLPMSYSASGDVTAQAVFVPGLGAPGDFPAETQGNIAFVQRGTLTFTEKVKNAEDAGAIGIVVYNNEPGNLNATVREQADIPAATISMEDGIALRDQAATGPIQVHLAIEANVTKGESQNVVAQMGTGDCSIVIGGHYDSVPAGPGANDNASGTAVAIEMARALAARSETDGVCVALFGSEEAGLLGSEYYVSQLTAEQRAAMAGYLNFDMLAVGDQWPMVGSESLVSLAIEKAAAIGVSAYAGGLPNNVGSDHASFIDAGIPAVLFNCFCDPNYHTAGDRYEFLDPARVKAAGDIGLAMAEYLLGE
jgi:aminopeptidase YwaD